jgi:hypothetical protein
VLIDYRLSAFPFVSYTNPSKRNGFQRKAAVSVGIYGGAAGVGYLIGGPVGAMAGVVAVPEVIVVPLILAV